MKIQISEHFDFKKFAKMSSSVSFGSGSRSTYSNKGYGTGYRATRTAVNDSMIGSQITKGLTTKLPNSENVYGKNNSGMGKKIPINSTMLKQRAGDVSIKNSPSTSMSANRHISTISNQGKLYKQAAIGAAIGTGLRFLGRFLAKRMVGAKGITKLRRVAIKGLSGSKISRGVLNRTTILDKMYRAGKLNPSKTYSLGGGARVGYKSIGTMSKSINTPAQALINRAAKRKALKWGVMGGTGYGIYRGAKFIKGTHTPYNPNFNYNRYIRENVISGRIDPRELHPNTIRSVMMKQGSFDKNSSMNKEAIISTLVKRTLPTAAWAALLFPGTHAVYKKKAILTGIKNIAAPSMLSMKGNIAKF